MTGTNVINSVEKEAELVGVVKPFRAEVEVALSRADPTRGSEAFALC